MNIWNSQRRSVSGCFYSIISVQCVHCLRYYCYCIISFAIHWDAVRNPGIRNQAFEELHLIKVVMQQDNKCESFFNHNIKTIFLLIFEGFSNVFPHVHAIFSLLFGKHVQNVYAKKDGKNIEMKVVYVQRSHFRDYFHQSLVFSFILLEIECTQSKYKCWQSLHLQR